ncbi:MAG TPA: palindromic element RPE4 domain-containing protein [Rickettsia endosymbiont of Pyrocoelia pectoralis]|nr:palindromic element RPE4 domain-containing protein [Rickettsia endosymbiont of Pyrocoelia pectoralis]
MYSRDPVKHIKIIDIFLDPVVKPRGDTERSFDSHGQHWASHV